PRHAKQIIKNGELIAVCDVIKQKADDLANQYQVTPYYTIDDLLANEKLIDIVSICTPNGLHAEHCIKSAQAGKHVLCEKPLCITSVAAWQMIETAKYCNKKLFVVKSTRYNPSLQTLKKILHEKRLGHIYSFQLNCLWNRPAGYYKDSWHGKLFPDGGTLYTQFSHYIDALLWLLGDIKTVTGFRKNLAHQNIIEFEDCGVAAIEMEMGAIGGLNWSVNTYQKNMEVSFTLIAEKGSVRIGGEYMNAIEYQLTEKMELKEIFSGNKSIDYGSYKGSMSNHDLVYENLLRAFEDDEHPFTNGFDGLKTVEAIERIYKSVSLS
ncbi:MAG: Gfo/Idh/MocA family oxidoreductase, partial [Bacteroidota bacterium]|nr:Gfo/Idh/MocA family oxidoreductase [Bacteroidota bacterium]